MRMNLKSWFKHFTVEFWSWLFDSNINFSILDRLKLWWHYRPKKWENM